MASSSVSQEDVENDFELSSRRSRIRTARARTVNPMTRMDPSGIGDPDDGGGGELKTAEALGVGGFPAEHDASPKPLGRAKEKRINRPNHMNKGKQQRDRRKLREKRRSTGVVHLPSTESTGNSTGEDEDEVLSSMNAETRRNTHHNEHVDRDGGHAAEERPPTKIFTSRRNKSPSDLEADDEDNQEFDSLNQSDSAVSSGVSHHPPLVPTDSASSRSGPRTSNGRPGTPTGENLDELLDRAQQENRRLLALLEDRDRKIAALENKVAQLTRDAALAATERDKLREENGALIRAMASLAIK